MAKRRYNSGRLHMFDVRVDRQTQKINLEAFRLPTHTREEWIRLAYQQGAIDWTATKVLLNERVALPKCWQCDEPADIYRAPRFYCSSHAPSLHDKDTTHA